MYIDCESVYSSSSAVKQTSETLRKKLIRYLCFISVDFIHSCHHCLKMSSFSLEKNRFRSINLTCWRSNHALRLRFLTALNTISWKVFWSKSDSSHFENSPSSQMSRTYCDVVQINEKFILNCPPCLLAEMAMLYKPPGAVYIASYKEPLDQSDCWKLFVQLWNYTTLTRNVENRWTDSKNDKKSKTLKLGLKNAFRKLFENIFPIFQEFNVFEKFAKTRKYTFFPH